jgi:hypothetical protein
MSPLLFSVALAAAPMPQRLALIIANNQSLDPGVTALRFADDDGARLYELLAPMGYRTELLTVLDRDTAEQHPDAAAAARPPTWARLERSVEELRRAVARVHEAGGEAEVVISFSGHGAVGQRGDPYVNLLDRRLYRGDFFRDVVAGIGADFVHVIVDACRARDFVDARGGPDGPDFDRELSLFLEQERRVQHPEVGVFVAESADGETHEWSRTRSGVFGHEVVSGLSGAADVNGDGVIEYSELHAFVASANSAIRDPRARLRVVAQPPALSSRRPLLRLTGDGPQERLTTPRAGGRYTIEDDRGVRWIDLNAAAGLQVTVHLPRRARYYVIDVTGSREAVAVPAGALSSVDALEFAPLATVARGSINEALASDLFRVPFGQSFYEGFAHAMRYPSVLSADPAVAMEPALTPPYKDPTKVFEPSVPLAKDPARLFPPSGPPDEAEIRRMSAVPAEEPASTVRIVRYASGAAAVAAGTLSAVFAYKRSDELDAFDTAQTQAEAVEAQERINRNGDTANRLFWFGVANGVAWAITWLVD